MPPQALAAALILAVAAPTVVHAEAVLRVTDAHFELSTNAGNLFTSADLVGTVLEITDAAGRAMPIRIDAVAPAEERAQVLLHTFSVRDAATGAWRPMCQPDAKGRRAGFPIAGGFTPGGEFQADASRWFVTCTSGSQGKCILWGYDPWRRGPNGEDLAPFYQACQFMTRADYRGAGTPFTRNGTAIDVWDTAGVQKPDSDDDPTFAFEAGWGSRGAVCVARTRIPQLLSTSVLHQSAPHLKAPVCDQAEARRRGALLFNRSRLKSAEITRSKLVSSAAIQQGRIAAELAQALRRVIDPRRPRLAIGTTGA